MMKFVSAWILSIIVRGKIDMSIRAHCRIHTKAARLGRTAAETSSWRTLGELASQLEASRIVSRDDFSEPCLKILVASSKPL
jgi:hypothetical protein